MNFITYIILGILGVFIAVTMLQNVMQTDFFRYGGSDKLILFLTRDISQEGRKYGPRVFTFWNLSHILYFALGSYLFPDKRLLLWMLGLAWEIGESFTGVMNPLDILWNSIGILIGAVLRNIQP
jgi:hypothetical protein